MPVTYKKTLHICWTKPLVLVSFMLFRICGIYEALVSFMLYIFFSTFRRTKKKRTSILCSVNSRQSSLYLADKECMMIIGQQSFVVYLKCSIFADVKKILRIKYAFCWEEVSCLFRNVTFLKVVFEMYGIIL